MASGRCPTQRPDAIHFFVNFDIFKSLYPQGGPRLVTTNPGEAKLPPLYWSVHLPARLVEAQLPPLYPGMVPVGPWEAQLPVCLLHTGVCTTLVVGFSSTNKNLEYMRLTLKFHWSTLSPTSPFSATLSCCYYSC